MRGAKCTSEMSHLPTALPRVPISSLNQPYLWICLPPEGGRELDVTPLHFADVVGSGVHLGRQVKDIDSIFGHYFKGEQRQPSDTGSGQDFSGQSPGRREIKSFWLRMQPL